MPSHIYTGDTIEANFDGLVGPTHNYSGLSLGNVASHAHRETPSNPKKAALQGLKKMKTLSDMGLVQGVFPPHERPDIHTLRSLGFHGSDAEVIALAHQRAPELLAASSSASCMWTANAATVSPSADTADQTIHFTPANLCNKFHRSIEHSTTGKILKTIFTDERHFTHHTALTGTPQLGDEGAANHTRFCRDYGERGVEFFVYGKSGFDENQPKPARYPARQTREASEIIARRHGLSESHTVFAQQNPDAIDLGVFHNDVIAVGNCNVLFCHEKAFVNQADIYNTLRSACTFGDIQIIEVPESRISIKTAVQSYLFNSQLISTADGGMTLVVPSECRSQRQTDCYLDDLVAADNPINNVQVLDLHQSMKNGGGPACLRLRVVLTPDELAATNPNCLLTESLYQRLVEWVNRHYRDRLSAKDLADPSLLQESRTALDELTGILGLGSIYHFQQDASLPT